MSAKSRRNAHTRRRAAIAGVAVVLLLTLAAAPLLAGRGDGTQPVAAAGGDDATSTTQATVPHTACRNSGDPACGPFRWDPDPGVNEPFAYTVTTSPADPHAGEPVSFTITRDDPDASVDGACGQSYFGDEKYEPYLPCMTQCTTPRFGPWTPPAKVHGHRVTTFTYTYEQPGTYQADFSARSGDQDGCNPYADDAMTSVTVVVR